MRLDLLFLLTVTLLFSGCLTPTTPEVPAWVEHPPPPTATTLYGVSVAESKEAAYVSALGSIASTMLKGAEPLLEQRVRDVNERSQASAAMRTVLQEIDYPGVAVKEEAEMGEDHAVLITMPRSIFAAQIDARLKVHRQTIEAHLPPEDAPLFTQLGRLGAAHEEKPMLLAEVLLLETADPAADTKPYYAFAEKTDAAYNALKFGVALSVISDAEAIVYVDTVEQALRSEGMTPTGNRIGLLLLHADSQQERRNGLFNVTMRVRLESVAKGERIAQNEFFLEAVSPQSFSDAKRRTAEALKTRLRERGLFRTLGF
ncbi:hypothetical protein [Sulfurimonas diazotrophicus]|uniref:LPP20 lipoprotein n=1 Tax=Sulfurimonas diazotrophicus TaxID=3131939 RepID=A0ABZ3H906_9BACT